MLELCRCPNIYGPDCISWVSEPLFVGGTGVGLLETNVIGPTHFYSVNMSVHFSQCRQSNTFHMKNALID